MNAEAVLQAHALTKGRPGAPLAARAHVVDPQFCDFLAREIGLGKDDGDGIKVFNILESGARALLNQYPIFGQVSVTEGRAPCLLVVGLGYLGEGLVVQAARYWRGRFLETGQRLPILALDRDAERRTATLRARYPVVEQACPLEPLSIDSAGPELQHGSFLFGPDGRCRVTTIYVCLGDDSAGLSAALTLRRRLGDQHVPIVVTMTHRTALARLLIGEGGRGQSDDITTFSLFERTCTPELLLEGIGDSLARVIHEEYRRELRSQGRTAPADKDWDDPTLDELYRDSSRRQADHIHVKLARTRCRLEPLDGLDSAPFPFTEEQVEELAELEHKRWVDERSLEGWIYDTERDDARKTNPYLGPWDSLPETIRQFDRNAVVKLPSILATVGLRIRPEGS